MIRTISSSDTHIEKITQTVSVRVIVLDPQS